MEIIMLKKIIVFVIFVAAAVSYAQGPTDSELIIFAAQKYKVDYTAQTPKSKDDIKKEYMIMSILGPKILAQGMQNDPEYKIAANTLAVEVWSKRFTDSLNIPDATLRKLYSQHDLKTPPAFNLHNILVKDEQAATVLVNSLGLTKDSQALLDKFGEAAKKQSLDPVTAQTGGKIGWIEIGRLSQDIQNALENKKKGDIFKVKVSNAGWQVFYIEDLKPARKATFEEAKPTLVNVVKQAELGEKVKEMLKSK